MRYIITGKNIRKGVIGDDIDDNADLFHEYFELGWEVISSRLFAIRMLREGNISIDDTIVTVGDRMFMYTKIFKNVISYKKFRTMNIEENNILDLAKYSSLDNHFISTQDINKDGIVDIHAKYSRFYDDYDFIVNFDFADISHLPIDNDYYCVCLRYRSHTPGRNSPDTFWDDFLKKMKQMNKIVFVVGYGAESKCDGKNIIHIEKLSEYASLINGKKCKSTIGVPTGTITLAFFCCTNKLFILDHAHCSNEILKVNNPLIGGESIRFMDIPYNFVTNDFNVDKIINKIL